MRQRQVSLFYLALVERHRQARQPARSEQDSQQRQFGQAHSGRTIIHQDDFIAGQRQLVPSTGCRSIAGYQELQPRISARIFDPVARFIGEFAEIHFPRVRGKSQHVDVGPGAKNAILRAGQDHRVDLWAFEPDALQGIVELDIHAQVIRIQFQFVAWTNPAVFRHVHRERGNRAIKGEPPVLVARRFGLIFDPRRFRLRFLRYRYVHTIFLLQVRLQRCFQFRKTLFRGSTRGIQQQVRFPVERFAGL